jgi:hypothetical protein
MSHENVYHLEHGVMLIMKCQWHSNNDRSPSNGEGCHTSGTFLVGTKHSHIPSTLGNNAIQIDSKSKPAFQMRLKLERTWPDMRVHHNQWLKTVSGRLVLERIS